MNASHLNVLFKDRLPHLKLLIFDILDSTNQKGIELLKNGIKDNCMIIAEIQTKGRGRLERVWESNNSKGIWASIVFPVSLDSHKYIKAISVAILEVIAELGINNASIKWPNDILIKNKKAAGILAESTSENNGLVLGFGLNVNQDKNDFSKDISNIATSLFLESGISFSKEETLINIADKFFYWINQTDDKLFDKYVKHSSSLGRICFIEGKKVYTKAILKNGGLLVINDKNKEETIYSGTLLYETCS